LTYMNCTIQGNFTGYLLRSVHTDSWRQNSAL